MATPRRTSQRKTAVTQTDDLATGSSATPARELTLEESLGAQIREKRRKADLTGTELANAAGISLGMLSKIENGQISPSLATLQSVSHALNISLSQLFATAEEQRDCSFVRSGQGVTIERRGTKAGHQYNLLGHLLSGPVVVEPYLISLHEGAEPYVSFRHDGIEVIYILTGRLIYRHGDQTYEMGPGDTLMFDSQAPHGPEKFLTGSISYLSIITYSRHTD
ncbi:aldehyde dehydrogenase [Acetobacter aceti NRIC 0242]|uniref:MerR family transcriptional regulator n=1 Tax=Acetobacter aceti NBRC 14818 TaxID=887700 RepID=A0AB33IH33_ACEAC|nr:XRE family transcriptional regulator [Acetobacter aceti]TCS28393.1 XRE family transcriptional regulator [Acetobacter aceti NBRC 14818]BCK76328.1 MerR family transcriptional regulator [Acetobacter aceti NBRC 14818]GAN58917.1 transcriptional regulator [Acetobacter aceti NBRC 14818]GBO80538.1 aldehyde dehydrogenase [Acetobacter aceti NRIC 0242]